MRAPVLKPTVKLEADAQGSRLVDSATGRCMTLSDLEALLVDLWDGNPDPAVLSRAASDASLPVEPRQVAVLLTRLRRAGFLAIETLPTAEAAVSLLSPEDAVPCLRVDLQLLKLTRGTRSTQVNDPSVPRSFTLFDFELSVARMLDGKRSAASVIDAAGKIGISVNLESLSTYLGQLQAFGFLGASSPAPAAETTWVRRRVWSTEIRALFRRALKLSREGQPHAALPLLAELLALEQENVEARELEAAVRSAEESTRVAELTFEKFHGAERSPQDAGAEPHSPAFPIHSLGAEVRKSLGAMDVSALISSSGLVPSPAPASAPEDPASSMPISSDELERLLLRRRNRWVLGGLGVLVVVACVGYLVRPVPWKESVSGRIEPTEVARPTAPRDGVVLTLEVRRGAEVMPGDALAKLDRAQLVEQLKALETKVEAALGQVREFEEEPCDSKVRARVTAKLAAARKQVDAVRRAQQAAQGLNGAQRERKLAALDSTAAARMKALASVEVEYEELTLDKALDAARHDVEANRALVEATRSLIATSTIAAPAAGVFLAPPDAVGLKLTAGNDFGRIVSRTAKVMAVGPFATTLPLPAAKLDLKVLKRPVSNEAWVDGPSGRALEGTVEIGDASLFGEPIELELTYGFRPYYRELLAR